MEAGPWDGGVSALCDGTWANGTVTKAEVGSEGTTSSRHIVPRWQNIGFFQARTAAFCGDGHAPPLAPLHSDTWEAVLRLCGSQFGPK